MSITEQLKETMMTNITVVNTFDELLRNTLYIENYDRELLHFLEMFLSFLVIVLIFLVNIPLLLIIIKNSCLTFLDNIIVIDCFLCIGNCIPLLRILFKFSLNRSLCFFLFSQVGSVLKNL